MCRKLLKLVVSLCSRPQKAWPTLLSEKAADKISPSPPSDGGEGWGEEACFYWLPLSSILSPLVPRGEKAGERGTTLLRARLIESKTALRSLALSSLGWRRGKLPA